MATLELHRTDPAWNAGGPEATARGLADRLGGRWRVLLWADEWAAARSFRDRPTAAQVENFRDGRAVQGKEIV